MGDPAGIGPEVALKAAASERIGGRFEIRLVGPRDALDEWSARLSIPAAAGIEETAVDAGPVSPGHPSPRGAAASLEAVRAAARACREGRADAMVTAPVSKETIAATGEPFVGHTEFLAELLESPEFVMTFIWDRKRVGLVTTHVPLASVAALITADLVLEKLRVLARGLGDDLGIEGPRIAVMGLNPHAGEGGRFGDEEGRVIAPAIEEARAAGVDARGPFPADAILVGLGDAGGAGPGSGFDAALAMYHDQATIPAKLAGFGQGVNVTLGLPVVRTSPDHGTAFDRAGEGTADPGSMIAAILLAGGMAERRANRLDARAKGPIESD